VDFLDEHYRESFDRLGVHAGRRECVGLRPGDPVSCASPVRVLPDFIAHAAGEGCNASWRSVEKWVSNPSSSLVNGWRCSQQDSAPIPPTKSGKRATGRAPVFDIGGKEQLAHSGKHQPRHGSNGTTRRRRRAKNGPSQSRDNHWTGTAMSDQNDYIEQVGVRAARLSIAAASSIAVLMAASTPLPAAAQAQPQAVVPGPDAEGPGGRPARGLRRTPCARGPCQGHSPDRLVSAPTPPREA
jgi:hypothetical protein